MSENRDFASYQAMAMRLEEKYKIDILCTDYYPVYSKFRIARKHVQSKAETSLVESFNSLIRHYLARFNRKTKRYSKSIDMVKDSLNLLFNKDIMLSIFK